VPTVVKGDILGKRPVLLFQALARVIIASAVVFQARALPLPSNISFGLQLFLLSWATTALIGLFLGSPKFVPGFLLMLLLDWLFAGSTLLLGEPVAGFLLLLFSEVGLRSIGWRWWPTGTVVAAALALVALAGAELYWHLGLLDLQVLPSDIPLWAAALVLYSLTMRLTAQRKASLERLSGDIWIDPTLASSQPFSYDFAKWIVQLASLFGERRSLCLLVLAQKGGTIRTFSNLPTERFQTELAKAMTDPRDHWPEKLQIVRDREADAAQRDRGDSLKQLHVLSLLDHRIMMARHFRLGHRNGLLLIAHDQPNDAILAQEAIQIDQALDDVTERIDRTMEMRRAFLTEAREVARRDLHDGVLQSLAALRMRLLTIIQSEHLTPAANAEIRNTADIIALEQARLRSLLDETVDADQPINLVEALRLCVKTAALQWEIDVEFVSDETAVPMHRESAGNVEYLVREVVANASRHSGSKQLRCSLALRDDNLIISLMDLSATPTAPLGDVHNGPLSSQSLRQRLALVNGRAYSEGLQTGTLLAVAIPLVYDEADL
jgi:signal transduction histidine kinase